MSIQSLKIDSNVKRAFLVAAAVVFCVGSVLAAKWGFGYTAARNADIPEAAELAISLGPDDPQTHYSAAVLFERTFVPEDQKRSLAEYEVAVALSPNNYVLWLEFGKARERSGDQIGAEAALRKALELAPNYSRVQWALGNAVLRNGKTEEAFTEIRKAVAGDATYTNSAAGIAWQLLGGDMAAVRKAIGDSTRLNAAIATLLAGQKRFDESFEIWNSLPSGEKNTTLKELGDALIKQMIEAKKFRYAQAIASQTGNLETMENAIANGGFEKDIKPQSSGIFEWQIADGTNPRIGPNRDQKHSGEYSLLVSFGKGGKEFRTVSQTVAVEPGKSYEIELFYRADLKTSAAVKWEVANAADGKAIAAIAPIPNTAEWAKTAVKFTVPAGSDGVIVRLVRENCETPGCSVAGNLWFDDFKLTFLSIPAE